MSSQIECRTFTQGFCLETTIVYVIPPNHFPWDTEKFRGKSQELAGLSRLCHRKSRKMGISHSSVRQLHVRGTHGQG